MINLPALDVVVGLAVVFLTVSLVCSSVNEIISTTLSLRANTLKSAVNSLVGPLGQAIIAHPVVPAVQSGASKRPSYIEPALFATALLDEITKGVPAPAAVAGVAPAANQFAHVDVAVNGPGANANLADAPALQRSLVAFVKTANGDFQKLHDQVSAWFDAYMDRVAGDYKRRSQWITALIAVVVVLFLNVDTLEVYQQLTGQPAFAQIVAGHADALLKEQPSAQGKTIAASDLGDRIQSLNTAVATIPIPIVWVLTEVNSWPNDATRWEKLEHKVLGLLITAIAASLGAPFWFDVLGKLANLRSAGTKPNGKS
jgi:hypothetical protein